MRTKILIAAGTLAAGLSTAYFTVATTVAPLAAAVHPFVYMHT